VTPKNTCAVATRVTSAPITRTTSTMGEPNTPSTRFNVRLLTEDWRGHAHCTPASQGAGLERRATVPQHPAGSGSMC
jgi:hypothetical protein